MAVQKGVQEKGYVAYYDRWFWIAWCILDVLHAHSSIVQNHKQRTNICLEILSTEKYYVATLKVIVEVLLPSLHKINLQYCYALFILSYSQLPLQFLIVPLREANPPILAKEDIKTIFSDIEILYNINSSLLMQLELRMVSWSPCQKIGDVFNTMVRSALVQWLRQSLVNHSNLLLLQSGAFRLYST